MRESCTFSNQILHVVLILFFPCHSPFRINTTDCPCHMVDAHISTRNFLIQQLLVQTSKKNTCQKQFDNWVMCWNEECKTRPFPIVKYCNPLGPSPYCEPFACFGKNLITRCRCMSMWQSSSCLFQCGKSWETQKVENFSPRNCWIFRHHKTHRNVQCRCHKLFIHCPDSAQIQRLVPCVQHSHHAPNAFQVALKNVLQICTSRSAFLQYDPVLIVYEEAHEEKPCWCCVDPK